MTYTENNIYWIITEQGREFHYPKALYNLRDAKAHLQKYVDEVGGKLPIKKNAVSKEVTMNTGLFQ